MLGLGSPRRSRLTILAPRPVNTTRAPPIPYQPGAFASKIASSACLPCASGFACPSGASAETACAAGTYAAAGSDRCSVCGKGSYSAAGDSECTLCPAEHTTMRAGTPDACDACERDFFFFDGSCRICPAHATCTGGQSQPAPHEGWWSEHSNPELVADIYKCLRPTCVGAA